MGARIRRLLLATACSFAAWSPGAHAADATTLPGQATFRQICGACHGEDGQGTAGIAPALAGTLAPAFATPEGRGYVARVLIYGLSGRIVSQGQTFVGAMPMQAALGDEQLAQVANYLAQGLNGAAAPVLGAEDFARVRQLQPPPTHKDLRELRARVNP